MEINVKRTCVEVCPYSEENRCKEIETYFSSYNKSKYKYDPIGFDYDADTKTLYLPRSVSLRKLELEFNKTASIDRSHDKMSKAIIQLTTQPKNDKQRESIAFLLGKNAYKDIENDSRRMLEIDTGEGKTYCAISAMAYMKVKGAVILNMQKLIDQWKEKIQQFTTLSDKEIFIVKGKDSVDKILNNKCKKYKIFLISHATINAYASKNGWNAVHELFEKMEIGVKVFDECHLEFENTIKIDLHTNTKKTYYLSATAGRSDYSQDILYRRVYGTVPTLKLKRDKKDAYVNSYLIKYDSKPTMIEEASLKSRMGLNIYKYIDYTIFGKGQSLFLKSLILIFNTILNREGIDSIAVLVGKIDATKFVKKFLENQYPSLKDNIIIANSTQKTDRSKLLDKKVIVTTFKSFGTGLDLESKLSVVIMCEPYSSNKTIHQCIGRLRYVEDKDLLYFEIYDKGIKRRSNQIKSIQKELLKCSKKVTSFKIE